MAFSSTFIHSKLSKVKLDTSAGALTDISDACNEVDMPEELELVETTTFGVTSKTYLVGFADGKISLKGPWSRSQHAHFQALKTAFRDGTIASASFEYGPEGTDTGDVKITCETVLVSYQKTSSAKEAVMFKAELQITGAVTEANY